MAVVEVLSPATAGYDQGEKFEHYRRIPSLQIVVYVWQDRRQIEVRTRTESEGWRSDVAGAGATAQIDPLACALEVDALYATAGA